MRTTLTLDDDVSARLEQEQRRTGVSFKALVNAVLRAGLDVRRGRKPRKVEFRTEGFSLGASVIGSLDNIEEVLSRVEGDDHA